MSTKRNAHVGFVHDEQALRRQIPHPLIATNVKGAYAIPAPPGDFDSNSASPDDLVKNGIYWRRPAATDDPALVKAWQRFFSRKWLARDRIVPNLEPQIGKTHILRKPFRRVSETNFLNADWAGAGLWGSPPPDRAGIPPREWMWTSISAFWDVPTVSEPSEPQGEGTVGWFSSSWIGIDGFDVGGLVSNDVLQAGVEQQVDASGHASYVLWFEWYAGWQPGISPPYVFQTNITSIPVAPGQQVFCHVGYSWVESKARYLDFHGSIFIGNQTTGLHTSLFLIPPPDASAAGNSIEWIMEAPFGGEPAVALPKFSPVIFTSAVGSGPDNAVGNPQNGDTVNIETKPVNGQVLTSVTVGNETVTINFIG